jgi:hypothetical protein
VNVGTGINSVTPHTNTDTGTTASSFLFSQKVRHSVFVFTYHDQESTSGSKSYARDCLLSEVYLMQFTHLGNLLLLTEYHFSGRHVIDFVLRIFSKVWAEPRTCNETITPLFGQARDRFYFKDICKDLARTQDL